MGSGELMVEVVCLDCLVRFGVHRSFTEQKDEEEEVDRTKKSAQSWREVRAHRS